MKIKYKLLLILLSVITLVSCKKNFLDRGEVGRIPDANVYSSYTNVQQAIWNIYSYLPDGFNTGLPMEAATDNAEANDPSSNINLFNTGSWNKFTNPDDVWSRNFTGINWVNRYLANRTKTNISWIQASIVADSSAWFNAKANLVYMRGEVSFLKAFFYFELVKRYGGVPIMNDSYTFEKTGDLKNLPRNTLDDCIKYITNLCDTAYKIVPTNVETAGYFVKGRVTPGAILALKSRVLFYAASPLFKSNGTSATWADAALALHNVIVYAATGAKYTLTSSYATVFSPTNLSGKELIFEKRYGTINFLEFQNFPIVFQRGRGFSSYFGQSITPTQDFVDAFEAITAKNGSGNATASAPFDWNNPLMAAFPYKNRDPRLAATVVSDSSVFNGTVIGTFTGGNSGLPRQGATRTGYYLTKWIDPTRDLLNNTTSSHTWIYFRYGGILLDYAEAMFNAYGATGDPFGWGKTALQAFNEIRTRAKMPVILAGDLTQARIENERRVELSFEDQRFWDVRRWMKGVNYFNNPVHRIEITRAGGVITGAASYKVKALENRVFMPYMNLYPIPNQDASLTGWQNAGW